MFHDSGQVHKEVVKGKKAREFAFRIKRGKLFKSRQLDRVSPLSG